MCLFGVGEEMGMDGWVDGWMVSMGWMGREGGYWGWKKRPGTARTFGRGECYLAWLGVEGGRGSAQAVGRPGIKDARVPRGVEFVAAEGGDGGFPRRPEVAAGEGHF